MKTKVSGTEYKPFFFPFPEKLWRGTIINRYKRFLADIVLENGQCITAHVANSGSMTTCWEKDAEVAVTWHGDANDRKLKYSLQAVKMPDGWVSVNTMNPNKALAQAIVAGALPGFCDYELLQTETKTVTGSRFDLALFSPQQTAAAAATIMLKPDRAVKILSARPNSENNQPVTLIEIKNATLRDADGVTFPDAVTARGQKHLSHLIQFKRQGYRCIILFFAGRSNTSWVGPASKIDPDYASLLKQAIACGVEALAVKVEVTGTGLYLCGELPVIV